MPSTRPRSSRRTRSVALRLERASECRFALALAVLLGAATVSVLATTSALSRQHAARLLALVSR